MAAQYSWGNVSPYLTVVGDDIVITRLWYHSTSRIGTKLPVTMQGDKTKREHVSFRGRFYDKQRLMAALNANDPRLLKKATENMPDEHLGSTPENVAIYCRLRGGEPPEVIAESLGSTKAAVILRVQSVEDAGYPKVFYTQMPSIRLQKRLDAYQPLEPLPEAKPSSLDEAIRNDPDDEITRLLSAF